MKSILCIDPGASGGLAWTTPDGLSDACPMPSGMTAQIDTIRSLHAEYRFDQCVIEKVGSYMPGNSGPAAATFARHCGHLEAACYALGLPVLQVSPQKWMGAVGTWPKDKAARKKAIKEEMARRFPGLNVTLKTADALGILCWAGVK